MSDEVKGGIMFGVAVLVIAIVVVCAIPGCGCYKIVRPGEACHYQAIPYLGGRNALV